MNIAASSASRASAADVLAHPGAPAETDPIFAAIERHRQCEAAYHARADLEDRLRVGGLLRGLGRTPERSAALKASLEARQMLSKTVPTTLCGLRVYLEYAAQYKQWSGTLLFEPHETENFMAAIAQTVRNIETRAPLR